MSDSANKDMDSLTHQYCAATRKNGSPCRGRGLYIDLQRHGLVCDAHADHVIRKGLYGLRGLQNLLSSISLAGFLREGIITQEQADEARRVLGDLS